MSVRADREREIAAAMGALAREHHGLAVSSADARSHAAHERTARVHEAAARQHRQLATIYDIEDAERRSYQGGALA
jgi:UDP-N-acetylmuramyl tripeptide synthase